MFTRHTPSNNFSIYTHVPMQHYSAGGRPTNNDPVMDLQGLLEDRGATLHSPDTTIKTEQLIQSWINDVSLATNHCENTPTSGGDFLSSVDWVHGDVGQSAKDIVQGLLSKKLDVKTQMVKKSHDDPTVSMEMRHKKVRERRVAKEQRRARQAAREALANEARQKAKEIVAREEALVRQKKQRDEQIIAHHMSQIRADRRAKEQHQRRLVAIETIPIANPIAEAEQLICEERRRQSTRAALLRQLEEAETTESKTNLKLLHVCFSRWYQLVVTERGRMAKAVAVREWRLTVRMWGAWRRWVELCQRRREREATARHLQRQRTLYQTACHQYRTTLLSRALRVWCVWVQGRLAARREEAVKVVYKKKMEALLSAAAQRVVQDDSTVRTDQGSIESDSQNGPQTKPHPVTPRQKASPPPSKPESPSPVQRVTEPALWSQAKAELNEVLTVVESVTTKNNKKTTNESGKFPPKKVTRPISLTNMERRSVAMATRRAARLERVSARERDRKEAQAQQEVDRQEAELAAKRQREAVRRAEKQAAKQRELEREERRNRMETLTQRARDHYRLVLLRSKGLAPWFTFVATMTQARALADKTRRQYLSKWTFRKWRAAAGQRSIARERMADELCCRQMLRKYLRAWRQYASDCVTLEELASVTATRLLTRRVLRAWACVTREERVRGWEKERQARKHHEKSVKYRALCSWIAYVPASRQERAQEGRRAELRRKVASWLHDYTPTDRQ